MCAARNPGKFLMKTCLMAGFKTLPVLCWKVSHKKPQNKIKHNKTLPTLFHKELHTSFVLNESAFSNRKMFCQKNLTSCTHDILIIRITLPVWGRTIWAATMGKYVPDCSLTASPETNAALFITHPRSWCLTTSLNQWIINCSSWATTSMFL